MTASADPAPSTTGALKMPSPSETRKRRLWMEMSHWLRIEIEARFGVKVTGREAVRNLEDMAATLVNSGELFDKEIQRRLETYESAVDGNILKALQTPIYVQTPRDAIMTADEVVALYDELAGINDGIEYGDDGYVRFASANDADRFREILARIEDKRNTAVFPKDRP